jgi:hypothetical protein
LDISREHTMHRLGMIPFTEHYTFLFFGFQELYDDYRQIALASFMGFTVYANNIPLLKSSGFSEMTQ